MKIDIGTLSAGQNVVKQVTINFSLTDGLKITQQGVQFVLTIHSDERTETFTYDYQP